MLCRMHIFPALVAHAHAHAERVNIVGVTLGTKTGNDNVLYIRVLVP